MILGPFRILAKERKPQPGLRDEACRRQEHRTLISVTG
jgi:hypothetical protein